MAMLSVDFEANAAYLEVSSNDVVETCEVAPGVQVDLDEYGCAVGIELLSLSLSIPVDEIGRKYHVRKEDLDALRQVHPNVTTFVARQSAAAVAHPAAASPLTLA